MVSYVLDLLYSAVMLIVKLIWTLALAVLLPIIVGAFVYGLICTIFTAIYENFMEFRIVRWTITLVFLLLDGLYYLYTVLFCR